MALEDHGPRVAESLDSAVQGRPHAEWLRIWRVLALLIAVYVIGQDAMRALRFAELDGSAGTLAVSYVRAPQFAVGYVAITEVSADGPMGKAGVVAGDHIRFDEDVRGDELLRAGESRGFILDHMGAKRHLQVAAVPLDRKFINQALYTRSLSIALSGLLAAAIATFIILRGKSYSALLLGISLVGYSLVNSAPWIGGDYPVLRQALNFFARTIQTMSAVAFIAFALQFYSEFVGPVRRSAWRMLGIYAILLLLLLVVSDILDGVIAVLPVIGDGQLLYTVVRLAGSIAALALIAIGWQRGSSEVRQRYAMLFAALFILVGSRVLYLFHFYIWQDQTRAYSIFELVLALSGALLSAPMFAYAILKQRVLDLGFVVSRTLVYGIISFGLLLTFGLIEWGSEQLLPREKIEVSAVVNATVALTIFVVFHRIRDFVERVVEHLLFRSWRENEATLRRFVREAAFYSKSDALAGASVKAVARFAHGAQCLIYLRRNGKFKIVEGRIDDAPGVMDVDDPLAVVLRADARPVVPADVGSSIPAAWALPMGSRGQLDGFLLIGPKPSGEAYRPDEVDLLGWAAEQIGLDLRALEVAGLERDVSILRIRLKELQGLLTSNAAGGVAPRQ